MKQLRKALWRYVRRRMKNQRYVRRRMAAGVCLNCPEPRQAHALRCKACGEKYKGSRRTA